MDPDQRTNDCDQGELSCSHAIDINNPAIPFKDICIADKYYITYFTCLVVGAGSLLPYTCLISSSDYFQYKYQGINIMLSMTTFHQICNFTAITFLIPFNHLISIQNRIIFCSLSTAIMFIAITNYAHLYSFILFIGALSGANCGTLCVSIIAHAQTFPRNYVQVAYVGQAASALIGSILRIITKLYFSEDPEVGAFVYFTTCAVIVLLGVVLFCASSQTEFVKYYYTKSHNARIANGKLESETRTFSFYKIIFKKLQSPAITIFSLLCVTCTVFPSLVVDIPSEFAVLNAPHNWMSVLLVTIYAVSDYVGRQVVILNISLDRLRDVSIMRFVLIPFLVVFYTQWCVNDPALYLYMVILGLSHGQLSCYAFMKYGKLLKGSEQETGAAIMEFFLALGLVISQPMAWGFERLFNNRHYM